MTDYEDTSTYILDSDSKSVKVEGVSLLKYNSWDDGSVINKINSDFSIDSTETLAALFIHTNPAETFEEHSDYFIRIISI